MKQNYFKSLQIIAMALPTGMSLFLALSILVNKQPFILLPADDQSPVLTYIALAMAVASVFVSNVLFQKALSKIDTGLPLSKKFPLYTSAYIVRFALLEGAGLFNVSVFLLTGILLNALIVAAIVLFMLVLRPQRQKTIDDLKIYYPDVLE